MTIHSLDGEKVLKELEARRNGPMIISRLRWLEDRLRWHGGFRRAELVQRFGISPQQASGDIATFQNTFPGAAVLDPPSKGYVPGDRAVWEFPKGAVRWLDEEAEHDKTAQIIRIERLAMPPRRGEDDVLAALIGSYETRRPLIIEYQSLNAPEPSRRVICAHVLVDTGERLHARAWDDKHSRFADFVIARILSAGPAPDYPWVDGRADGLWHDTVEVVLEPAEGLSPAQRKVVEREFGMRGGRLAIKTRKALATYVLDRLGLVLKAEREGEVSKRLVRCANFDEIRGYIPRATTLPH